MTYEEFIKELDSYNSKSKSDPYAGMSLEEAFKKIGTEREWDKLVNELGNVRSGVTYQTGANEVKKSNDAYKSITNQLRNLYANNKQYFSDSEAIEKYLSDLDANAAQVDKYAVNKKFTELYNGLGDAYNKLNKSKDTDSFKSANNEYGSALAQLNQFVSAYGSEIENKDLIKSVMTGAFENAASLDRTIKGGDEAIKEFMNRNFYGPLQNMSYEELIDIANGKTYQGQYDEDERRTIGAYALSPSKKYTKKQYDESIKNLEDELRRIDVMRAKGSDIYGSETDARKEEINNALSILKADRTAYERTHKGDNYDYIDYAADNDRYAHNRDYHIPTLLDIQADLKNAKQLTDGYFKFGLDQDDIVYENGTGISAEEAFEDPLGFYLQFVTSEEHIDPNDPTKTYTRKDFDESLLSSVSSYVTGKYVSLGNSSGMVSNTYEKYLAAGFGGNWQYLTEEEIDRYYYLLGKKGKAAALQYLSDMEYELGERAEGVVHKVIEGSNAAEKALYNFASVGTNVLGGVSSAAGDLIGAFSGKDYNPYNFSHAMQNFATDVRSITAQDISEGIGGGFGTFVGNTYQGVMSGLDSIFGSTLFKGGYTVLMGINAATQKAQELYERGATKEQIITGSILSGVIEWFTEKLSYDFIVNNIWGKIGGKSWIESILGIIASGINEGIEEVNADWANAMADSIIMGALSLDETEVRELMAQGMSEAEARDNVFAKNATEMFWSWYGGFISGAGMSGSGYVGNTAINKVKGVKAQNETNEAIGRAISEQGNIEKFGELSPEAKALAGKDTENMSERQQKKYYRQVGKTVSKEYGKSSSEVLKGLSEEQAAQETELAKDNRSAYESVVEQKAKENGASDSEAKTIAKAFSKYTLSENVSKSVEKTVNDAIEKGYLEKGWSPTDADIRQNMETSSRNKIKSGLETKRKINELVYGPKSDVNESGKTTITATEEEANIESVVGFKNGKLMVRLDNGKTVSHEELSYANKTEAMLYDSIAATNADSALVNEMLKDYKGKGTADALAFVSGIVEGYDIGFQDAMTGTKSELPTTGNLASLSSELQQKAYDIGHKQGEKSIGKSNEAVKAVKNRQAQRKSGKVDKHLINTSGLTDRQSVSVKAIENFSAIAGNKVVLFASEENADGKRVYSQTVQDVDGKRKGDAAPNGFYDRKTGTIYVDINAGNNGEGAIMYTYAHELTHFIEQWSPTKYRQLLSVLYGVFKEQGVNIHNLAKNQQAIAKRSGNDLSYEEALGEVVADSMSQLMTHTNFLTKLSQKLYAKDKSLWGKVRDFFSNSRADIYALYKDLDPDSEEGRIMSSLINKMDEIIDIYSDAVIEAGENFSRAEGTPAFAREQRKARILSEKNEVSPGVYATEEMRDSGIEFNKERGELVFSPRYSALAHNLAGIEYKSLINDIVALTNMSSKEAEAFIRAEGAMALSTKGTPYDFAGSPLETAIKSNSDYPQGTIDFNTNCTKRIFITKLINKLQAALPEDLFTADDYADIRLVVKSNSHIVACGLCFVEDRRQHLAKVANDFIDEWKKSFKNKTNLTRVNSKGEIKPVEIGKNLAKRYGVKAGAVASNGFKLTQNTFSNSDEWFKLQKEHPEVAAAFEAYNNARGQSAERLMAERAEYKREILSWDESKVKAVNDAGGLRIYSFSDFESIHLVDIMQIIEDCAAKGVKIQGYTKQPAFARLVRNTGMKLNRSLIPYGKTGLKYVNGKPVLVYDTVEGMNPDAEDFIDETNNPNVGNNITGINDTQIRVAMLDKFIDYIIPFHSNKSGSINYKLGVGFWTNYKDYQLDKFYTSDHDITEVAKLMDKYRKEGMQDTDAWDKACKELGLETNGKKGAETNIYTEVLSDPSVVDEKTFVEKFLAVCEEKKVVPRFAQFLNVDKNGKFVFTKGYAKMLVDFKLFDQKTGKILPQGNIVPKMDLEFAKEFLDSELQKATATEGDQEIPEDLYAELLNYIKVKHNRKQANKLFRQTSETIAEQTEKENADKNGTGHFTLHNERASERGKIDNARYLELAKDPEANEAELSKMVESAARAAGYDYKGYHGTDFFGFTKFDRSASDDRLSFFFSSSPNVASSYTDKGKVKEIGRPLANTEEEAETTSGIYGAYLSMKNPFELDCDYRSWNRLDYNKMATDHWNDDDSWFEDTHPIEWRGGNTREIVKWAESQGYDGVIFRNIRDVGKHGIGFDLKDTDKPNVFEVVDRNPYSTVYAVFDSSQIKSADPVTYDDNGNVIPLTERFNENEEDIRHSERNKTSTDSRYLELAKDPEGNKAELQRMVDEAAKAAGYSVKVYHGTVLETQSASRGRVNKEDYDKLENNYADKLFPFVVFKTNSYHPGIYTATDRGVAKEFSFSFSHGGTVFDLYAKAENPFVFDANKASWKNLPKGVLSNLGLTDEALRGLDSYKKTRDHNAIYMDDVVEFAQKNGYDAVIAKNVRETGFGDETSPVTIDVVVFDSNQIKSADPVTYDDDGNVIPLSERFNEEKEDIRYSERKVNQEISSAATSIKQIPALFNNPNVEFGKTNVDIGGGRFDLATNFLKEKGVTNYIFDPFNRGEESNTATLDFVKNGGADTVTCANVPNVIAEPEARANVILEAAKAIKKDGKAYFMVYEGDGSGEGKKTSAGWQNNRKTADYVGEISEYFNDVQKKGKLIIASNPVDNLPKAYWEVSPGKGERYHLRGWTKDGRAVYETGFDDSVPMEERIKTFKKYLGTIINLGGISLKTDTKKIHVNADKFTTAKTIYGPEIPLSIEERSALINSLFDVAHILSNSKYVPQTREKMIEPSYADPTIAPKNKAHKDVKYWYKFKNNIVFDGVPYEVVFNIRDKGKEQYEYLIEFHKKTPNRNSDTVSKRNLALDGSASKKYIPQPSSDSQEENQNSLRKDSSGNALSPAQQRFFADSKIRDEDGNLLVVYHGTYENFTVFDRTKGRSTADIQGMFFSPWELDAKGYGPNVEAYYLNITNPASEAMGYKALNMFKGQNEAGRKAREYLESLGYDGVNNGNEEYIAFYSNQIKRTDNINPTENDDTRFSDRNKVSLGSRSLLANALETVAQNDAERELIAKYKTEIDELNKLQKRMSEISSELYDLSFAKGPKDTRRINELRAESTKVANRINIRDKRLLNMEATKALKGVVERERAKAKKSTAQQYREMIKEQRDSRRMTEVRTKIKKLHNKLIDTINHPTESKYVPAGLYRSMANVLEALDITSGKDNKAQRALESKREDAIARMALWQKEYHKLKDNADYDYSSEYVAAVENEITKISDLLEGQNIYDPSVSLDVLENVYKIARSITDILADAKKLIGERETKSVRDSGFEIIRNQEDLIGRRKNLVSKGLGALDDKASLFFLNTLRAVKKMSGYDDNAELVRLFDELNEGVKKKYNLMMEAAKKLDALTATKEGKEAYQRALNEQIEVAGIKMTRLQAYQIYMTIIREQNVETNHIGVGGITVTDNSQKTPEKQMKLRKLHNGVDVSYLYNAIGDLIRNDKFAQDYIAVAKDIFNNLTKNALNEASLKLEHRLLAEGEYYIPFVSEEDFLIKETGEVIFDGTIRGRGFTKTIIKGSVNPLLIEGLNVVLDRAINNASDYYGLAIPIRNINKALNVKSDEEGRAVKWFIEQNWGKNGLHDVIEQSLSDLQTSRKEDKAKILDTLRSFYVTSVLNGNISVAIKQAASLDTAFAVLDYRPSAVVWAEFAKTVAKYKQIIAEIDEHTSEHWRRRIGLSSDEVATITKDVGLIGKINQKLPTPLNGMKWIQGMDCITTATFWTFAKQDVAKEFKAEGKETGTDEYWERVTELYEQTIEETQPMYDTLHRSEIQKNRRWNKYLMFKTQPLQNAGLLYMASHDLVNSIINKDGHQKEKAQKFAKVAVSQTRSAITFAIMTALAAMLRGKMDKYKDKEEKVLTVGSVLKALGLDVAQTASGVVIPALGSELFTVVDNVFISKKAYNTDLLGAPDISAINDTVSYISKAVTKPTWENVAKAVTKLTDLGTGVPATNIYNLINGVRYNITDAVNGEFGQFNAGSSLEFTKGEEYVKFLRKGDTKAAKEYYDAWIAEKIEGGSQESNAKSGAKTSISNAFEKLYIRACKNNDERAKSEIRLMMKNTGLYKDANTILEKCKAWETKAKSE